METSRAIFSLRWKILAWFFVNLLVLGGGLFVFFRVQFHVGVGSLLTGPTSDRLEAIAEPLAAELRGESLDQWRASLARATAFWRARGLHVGLFWDDGTLAVGDIRDLPAQVRDTIRQYERRNHGPGPRPGGFRPPDEDGQGDGRDDGPPPGPPPDDGFESPFGPPPDEPPDKPRTGPGTGTDHAPPAKPPSPPRGVAPPGPASNGPLDKFMLVAGNPPLYWAGVHLGRVRLPTRGGPPRRDDHPPSATLLFSSGSLRGGGLFFDYVPILALGGGLALVSVLLWLPFVHGLNRALARMTRTAEEIARGNFEPPVPTRRRDELGRLGRALGHMAQRLDGFVTGQRRFLGDTAHELLSPLARLEVSLSILEQRAGPDGDRRYTDLALAEVRQMAALVGDLLSFTKAGLRAAPPVLAPVGLAALARQTVEREGAQALVTVSIDDAVRVSAEPDLLGRALGNAVRNAVRYAGDDGPITIHAAPSGEGSILLNVTDHGPGVPPGAIDRLFDPFFRPEAARTRETGGTGLGLAIVKSCVEACGGQVAVRNCEPRGLELTFTLRRAE